VEENRKMTVDDIIKELKKNPHFDENLEAFEKFFQKIDKVSGTAAKEKQ